MGGDEGKQTNQHEDPPPETLLRADAAFCPLGFIFLFFFNPGMKADLFCVLFPAPGVCSVCCLLSR